MGGGLTPDGAANLWVGDMMACGVITNPSYTKIGAAAARYSDTDNATAYVILMR